MKKCIALVLVLVMVFGLAACSTPAEQTNEKIAVKLLLISKFEIGEMTGDMAGEAQLFYEEYLGTEPEMITLSNGSQVYYNKENGVLLGTTSAGKQSATMFTTALLSDARFDFSNTYALSVGCAGSAYGVSTMGDVAVISGTVDFDLGYEATAVDKNGNVDIQWYDNTDTAANSHKALNADLVKWAYEKTKDVSLKTTEITLKTLKRNFPDQEWALRDPKVITGTSVTSDTYWKGEPEHQKASYLAEYYKCADPYAITEMEDNACAIVFDSFGMLDRLIILRVSVNVDILLDGATAESTWGDNDLYTDSVQEDDNDSLDIFSPAMENLFAVGKVIGDSVLEGTVLK